MQDRTAAPPLPGSGGTAAREFWVGLARAFGGAILFGLPLLMTMEMWWLGFYMHRGRLALFMAFMIPMLVGLSYYSGFKETARWQDELEDAFVAYGVGFVASAAIAFLLGIINLSMPANEIVGKISLQAVPASFGAVLARSQFGERREEEEARKERAGYWGELFLMAAGALFLAFTAAPTEEMLLIAFRLTPIAIILLAIASILMMHAFVYAVDFKGQAIVPPETPWWHLFLRFTVAGYALVLLLSAYVLWTFGHFEAAGLETIIQESIVLAFPGSLGAAVARLIL